MAKPKKRKTKQKTSESAGLDFKKLVNLLPTVVAEIDEKFKLVYLNKAGFRLLGYTKKDLERELNFLDMIHEKDKRLALTNIKKLIGKKKFESHEYTLLTKDGREIEMLVNSNSKFKKGKFVGMTVSLIKINKRKKVESDLKNIFNFSEDLICTANIKDSTFIKVNPAFEKIFGYEVSEFEGRLFSDFIHPEDKKKTAEVVREKLRKGEAVIHFENRYRCKSGKYKNIEWTSHPIKKEGITYATGRDVTEKKKLEKELERTLEATTDGIWSWNFKTNELFFSPKYYSMLGYEPNEFEASYKNWMALIHPEDKEAALKIAEAYLNKKSDEYKNEFRMKTKKGEYRWINAKAKVVERDSKGRAVYIIGNHEDITEKKEAEEKLKKNKRILNKTGEIAKIGGWEINLKNKEVYWTDETYRIHEVPIGKKINLNKAIKFFSKEDQPKIKKAINRAIKLGKPYDMDLRFITAKGKKLWTHTACEVVKKNGKVIKIAGTFQDITEKKKIELEKDYAFNVLGVIRDINQLIVREKNRSKLIQSVVEILSSSGSYNCTFISLLDSNQKETDYCYKGGVQCSIKEFRKIHSPKYIKAVIKKRLLIMDDVTKPPFQQHFDKKPPHRGIAIILNYKRDVFGVLTVHLLPNSKPGKEEISLLKELAGDISFALHNIDLGEKKQITEEEIVRRDELLVALNNSARTLLTPLTTELYQKFVDQIGPVLGNDRMYVFLNNKNSKGRIMSSQVAEWSKKGVFSQAKNPELHNFPFEETFPTWKKKLVKGLVINKTKRYFPKKARTHLENQNIKALLLVPMIIDLEFIGFVGIDNCTEEREWTGIEENFLRAATENLTQSIRRKRNSDALQKREEEFSSMVEELPFSVMIMNKKGKVLQVNKAWKELWKLNFENLKNYNILKDHQFVEAGVMKKIKEGFAGNFRDIPMVDYDISKSVEGGNVRRNIESKIYSIKNEKGKISKVVFVQNDVTEKRVVEKALKAASEYSKEIIEGVNAIICGITTDGIITFINTAGTKITGYNKREIVGRNWWKVMFPGKEQGQIERLSNKYKKGDVHDYELRLTTKSGEKKTILWSSVSRLNKAGKFVEIVGFGIDITEREKAKKRLEGKMEELKKMNSLMVGRELKMIELKEKISNLKKRLEDN